MSDHTDTIRRERLTRALDSWGAGGTLREQIEADADALLAERQQAQSQRDLAESRVIEQRRELESLRAERKQISENYRQCEAERQQAIDDLDRATTAANRIEQQLVEASSVMTKLRAERQQAIDALREIAGMCREGTGGRVEYATLRDASRAARAALAQLGEQP